MKIIKNMHHAERNCLTRHIINGIAEVNLLENVKFNKYCKNTVPNMNYLFEINRKTAKK